jgi:hypothetical protein
VEVLLAPVVVPRLGSLLTEGLPESFEDALKIVQQSVDRLVPPRLAVDLPAGCCRLDDVQLPVRGAYLVWYAALASARGRGEGWVEASGDDEELKAMIDVARRYAETWEPVRMKALRFLAGESLLEYDHVRLGADLRGLRTRTRGKLSRWCASHRPFARLWVEPEVRTAPQAGQKTGQAHFQRLLLPPAHIELIE